MEMETFFDALGSRLAEAREADRRRHERFFSELAPRLDAARSLDRELDRHLARRFNVFDYLRTDELGLSHVIADFLDPVGRVARQDRHRNQAGTCQSSTR